tara:strand:- start:2252 stop:2656 length:405 start_codon:yes stop_codon:yes gene_type:complete
MMIAKKLISVLEENQAFSDLTAAPVMSINVPFQRSSDTEFLAVSVLLRSDNVSLGNVESIVEIIVDACKLQVEASELWGVDVLICGELPSGSKKILRIMLPKSTLATFTTKEMPINENRNFNESEVGVIWYENL